MSNTYKIANNNASAAVNYSVSNNTLINATVPYNGSNTYSISNTNGYSVSPNLVINNEPASLEVKGKIIHNGRDLEERLSMIEQVLQIPERDVKLEKKYPKLKKLYDEYMKELNKSRMWESLKGEE